MLFYESLDDMWLATISHILHEGFDQSSRNGSTKDILAYQAILLNPQLSWLTNERRAVSPATACAEALWYMSGESDVTAMQRFAPQYINYAEEDGKAYGAYGSRLFSSFNKIAAAIEALREKPDTRRCFVSLWEPFDLVVGHGPSAKKDVPCTLGWTFLIRDDKLNMIVKMRSQDAWLGMPYDIFWNCIAMHTIASELNIELGMYVHQCDSIHVYEKNMIAAYESLTAKTFDYQQLWGDHCKQRAFKLRMAGKAMVAAAKGVTIVNDDYDHIGNALLNTCFKHLGVDGHTNIQHPVLRHAEEIHNNRKAKQ